LSRFQPSLARKSSGTARVRFNPCRGAQCDV
jgi:hypothetical protein